MTTTVRAVVRARKGTATIAIASSLVVLGGPWLISAGPATAASARPAAPALGVPAPAAPTIEQVSARIDALNHEAEQATEAYDTAGERLASATVVVQAARVRVQQQQAAVAATRRELGRVAAQLYQRGQLSSIKVVMSDDPADVLARAGLAATVADRQAAVAERLSAQQAQLSKNRTEVQAQQKQAAAVQAQMAASKATVQLKISQAQAELNRLRVDQRRALERASRERQRVALAQAVARAAVQENAAPKPSHKRRTGSSGGGATITPGAGGTVRCGGMSVKAPTARAAKAIAFACSQLGEPYHFGSAGPGSWDCSGLTMMSWRKGGVSLPHSSSGQYGYGRHVGRSSLQPGDLVFFYSPISHVGIALGGGMMIHAPHTGDVVRLAPIYSGFAGGTRL